ncbi:MAG: hypothetical protein R3F55_22085 [Alphaproteobacteria bacterium]
MLKSVAGVIALSVIGTAQAQTPLGPDLLGRAREACAPQIERAYTALIHACTAAAVIERVIDPVDPLCYATNGIVVEYLKACLEHAASLIGEGRPLDLPPFPGLGAEIVIDPTLPPMPPDWPQPFPAAAELLPSFAAAMKHEALAAAAGQQLALAVMRALSRTPDRFAVPAESADAVSGEAAVAPDSATAAE